MFSIVIEKRLRSPCFSYTVKITKAARQGSDNISPQSSSSVHGQKPLFFALQPLRHHCIFVLKWLDMSRAQRHCVITRKAFIRLLEEDSRSQEVTMALCGPRCVAELRADACKEGGGSRLCTVGLHSRCERESGDQQRSERGLRTCSGVQINVHDTGKLVVGQAAHSCPANKREALLKRAARLPLIVSSGRPRVAKSVATAFSDRVRL